MNTIGVVELKLQISSGHSHLKEEVNPEIQRRLSTDQGKAVEFRRMTLHSFGYFDQLNHASLPPATLVADAMQKDS